MINRWIGMGRLVAAPELKKTQNGISVCTFKIAVDRDRERDKADFVPCVAWRQTADFVADHFDKGKLIAVSGEMHNREWTDREGNKRMTTEITVDRVWFCGDRVKADADYKTEYNEIPDDDGDLPFMR